MGGGVLMNGFLIALPRAQHTWRNSPDTSKEPEGRHTEWRRAKTGRGGRYERGGETNYALNLDF